MDDKQTVADGQGDADASPKAEAEDSPGAADAQEDDLETLLAGVDTGDFEPEKKQEESTNGDDLKSVLKYIQNQETEKIQSAVSTDLEAAVEKMAAYSDTVAALPAEFRHGYLLMKAEKEPGLLAAFANRGKDPATWNRIVTGLAKSMDTLIAKVPDAQLTSEREAALASVRGASNTAPQSNVTAADIRKMSDAELDALNASGSQT